MAMGNAILAASPRPARGSARQLLTTETGVRYCSAQGGRLTKHDAQRKRKIIDYIAATLRESGYPPSVREIAAAVGLASTSAVHHHLSALEQEGLIERDATQSRALRLNQQHYSPPDSEVMCSAAPGTLMGARSR